MKKVGIPNPFYLLPALLLGRAILFITDTGPNNLIDNNGDGLLIIFLFLIFIVIPVALLMTLRVITIDNETINILYPFQFKTRKYLTKDIKSVFTQKLIGNTEFFFDIFQTYLYFGEENRIRFSQIEFLNYGQLRKVFEKIRDAKC
jgi:hypothetical protein